MTKLHSSRPLQSRALTDFGRLRESTHSDRELYDAMTELYPDWVSHQAWLMFTLS